MMLCRSIAPFVLGLVLTLCYSQRSEAQRTTYQIREIAGGFNVPWEMRIAPDGWLFFTERPGRFSKLNPATGETNVLLRASDCVLWHEAGMLGFDFHPNFPDSPFIYIAYVYKETNNKACYGLFRFTYTGDSLIDRVQLFGPAIGSYSHNGSRVVVRDNKIFFSTGDVIQFEIAQNVNSAHGKINRLNLDGSIPDDNPFPGSATWSYGHRNPQGLDFGPNEMLYSSEHGDATDDEINAVEKGRNYGWPFIHGFCDSLSDHPRCEDLNIKQPLAVFTPTLAASDLAYFDHPSFPEWKHSILLASLRDQSLHQFKLSEDGQQILSWERYNLLDNHGELCGRLRSVCLSKDGRVYLSTGNGYAKEDTIDKIFELVRTGVEPANVRLEMPPNESVLTAGTHYFRWRRPFVGATSEIQIATGYDFDSVSIVYRREVTDSTVYIEGLTPGIRYYWRVREIETNGNWSEIRTFVEEVSAVNHDPIASLPTFDVVVHGRSIAFTGAITAMIEVYDLLGRKYSSMLIEGHGSSSELSLGTFDHGVYFVRVATGKSVVSRRVIVQ